MPATVSHYPRVSEWVYIGDTAINMAQVTDIEFGGEGDGAYAIVRLATYQAEYDVEGMNRTWFKLKDAHLVRALREYVEGMSAPLITAAAHWS